MIPAGQTSPAFLVYHFLWEALDWVFPPTCGGCNTNGTRWCQACQQRITPIAEKICPQCGDTQPGDDLCLACQQNPPAFEMLRSFAAFQGPIRNAIHRLKYERDVGVGESLSKHLIELYNRYRWSIDLVVPVPLSDQRRKQRGYNQAELLGRPLAYAIHVPYRSGILTKQRETHTQVGLSAYERALNVTGAFKCQPSKVQGKIVLIVDDVTTTGSTINACAQALREAGASAVFGLTLARAVLQADADDQPKSIS